MAKVLVLGGAEQRGRRADGVSDPRPINPSTALRKLCCLDFDLGAPTPDANTIRLFRKRLTQAGALDDAFVAFDRQLQERGYLPMGGQIVDATLVAAPKQRNTDPEKAAIKNDKAAGDICSDEPAKATHRDTDAHWK